MGARRSPLLREAVEVISAVLLIAAWTLVTLFPEGGLQDVEATLLRGATAAAAALLLLLVMSWPLKAVGLMRWSPLYDGFVGLRDARRRRLESSARERQQRREAPYRAIQSLGD